MKGRKEEKTFAAHPYSHAAPGDESDGDGKRRVRNWGITRHAPDRLALKFLPGIFTSRPSYGNELLLVEHSHQGKSMVGEV